jgi:hypothetical protein
MLHRGPLDGSEPTKQYEILHEHGNRKGEYE